MKRGLIAGMALGAFLLGANCSDELRKLKSLTSYNVSETGYEHPYSVRVSNVDGRDGLETYLVDDASGESRRLLRGMRLEERKSLAGSIIGLYYLFK